MAMVLIIYRMRRTPRTQATLTASMYRRDLVHYAWSTLARAATRTANGGSEETTDEHPKAAQREVHRPDQGP